MIFGVNHIGIAVENLSDIKNIYTDLLPDAHNHEETVAEQKAKTLSFAVGDTHIEFLEPTSAESPIAKFLEKKGQGVHHIALSTDNIAQDLERLKQKGFRLIDETPRNGINDSKIAFIHPKSTGSVLIELCQNAK